VAAARALGYRLVSYVSSRATAFPGFAHGDNCFILEDNTLQPFARIGHNVTLWSGNHIGHHTTIGDHCFIASHVVISGSCKVGNNCFIGVNATFHDSLTIAEECLVGAGAIISKNTNPMEVFVPASTKPFPKNSEEIGF